MFGGKIILGKKVCNFKWHLVLSQKYSKSFGVKNLALCGRIFPIKSQSICLNSDWTLFKSAEFFSFSQPYIVKK